VSKSERHISGTEELGTQKEGREKLEQGYVDKHDMGQQPWDLGRGNDGSNERSTGVPRVRRVVSR
jgi:hypothetical protein